jgi:diaminopimelate epimerase
MTSKRVNIHFKGGIITIDWSGDADSRIIMIGDYQKIFLGFLSKDFLIK